MRTVVAAPFVTRAAAFPMCSSSSAACIANLKHRRIQAQLILILALGVPMILVWTYVIVSRDERRVELTPDHEAPCQGRWKDLEGLHLESGTRER